MIEAPIVAVTSNGLGLAGKSGGAEVALANGAQAVQVGRNIVKAGKVSETEAATIAERAQIGETNLRPKVKLRPANSKTKKAKNFSSAETKEFGLSRNSLGIDEADSLWESSGAQILKPKNQGLEGGQSSNPWLAATTAKRIEEAMQAGNIVDIAA
jgi:hypothetical protein